MQFECYVTMVSLPFLWYDRGAVCGHLRGVMIVQRYNCLSDWSVCMLAMFPVGALWDQRFDVAVVNTTKPKMINTWLTTLTKLPLSGLQWCCFVIDHTHSLIIYNPPDSCNGLDSSDCSSRKQRSRWQKLLPIDQTGSFHNRWLSVHSNPWLQASEKHFASTTLLFAFPEVNKIVFCCLQSAIVQITLRCYLMRSQIQTPLLFVFEAKQKIVQQKIPFQTRYDSPINPFVSRLFKEKVFLHPVFLRTNRKLICWEFFLCFNNK